MQYYHSKISSIWLIDSLLKVRLIYEWKFNAECNIFFKKSFPFELLYSNGKLFIKKYCTQPMRAPWRLIRRWWVICQKWFLGWEFIEVGGKRLTRRRGFKWIFMVLLLSPTAKWVNKKVNKEWVLTLVHWWPSLISPINSYMFMTLTQYWY